jgi:hypothetical protein
MRWEDIISKDITEQTKSGKFGGHSMGTFSSPMRSLMVAPIAIGNPNSAQKSSSLRHPDDEISGHELRAAGYNTPPHCPRYGLDLTTPEKIRAFISSFPDGGMKKKYIHLANDLERRINTGTLPTRIAKYPNNGYVEVVFWHSFRIVVKEDKNFAPYSKVIANNISKALNCDMSYLLGDSDNNDKELFKNKIRDKRQDAIDSKSKRDEEKRRKHEASLARKQKEYEARALRIAVRKALGLHPTAPVTQAHLDAYAAMK